MFFTTEDNLRTDHYQHCQDKLKLREFVTTEFLFEVFSICMFPLPYYETYIVSVVQGQRVVYLLSDFMLALMFLRLYTLIKTGMSYSAYTSTYAKQLCHSYGFDADFFFTLKSKLAITPVKMVIQMFIGTVLTHALINRILELPYSRLSNSDLSSISTSVWLSIITLTTIGYGDYSPQTPAGRLATMIYAFWGALFLSLLVVACTSAFNLTSTQKLALHHVKMTRSAAHALVQALRYNLVR